MERPPRSSVWHIVSTLTHSISYATITAVYILWSKFLRILEMIKSLQPVYLTEVILDFVSAISSLFWDGRRTGPMFISPMSSLSQRQSGHLAKLVLQYSDSLAMFELESTDDAELGAASVYDQGHSQAVVVLDLDEIGSNEVAPGGGLRRLESQYTTSADADLMAALPTLVILPISWAFGEWVVDPIILVISFTLVLMLGPCTLTLFRRTGIHPLELDPGDGCAVLMDDDMTVVIQGSQRIVDAITEGGFYLSFQTQPLPSEDGVLPIIAGWETHSVSDYLCAALEGGYFEGSTTTLANSVRPIPLPGAFALLVFWSILTGVCLWASRRAARGSLPSTVPMWASRRAARGSSLPTVRTITSRLFVWMIQLLAASMVTLSLSTAMSIGIFFTSWYGLMNLRSRSYRIRMDRFLRALGRPTARKWPFSTRASAVTFVCLVLCRDLPRPVKNIDVLGVLDILIPDQRDIWRVWKARVADRIAHEERIDFAPTIPTFPDSRQERLKCLLAKAQSGYNAYISLPPRRQSRRG